MGNRFGIKVKKKGKKFRSDQKSLLKDIRGLMERDNLYR